MGKYQAETPAEEVQKITFSDEQIREFDRLVESTYHIVKFSKHLGKDIKMFDRNGYLVAKGAATMKDGVLHVVPHLYNIENERIDQWERYRDRKAYAKAMETKELEAMAAQMGDDMRV